MAHRVDQVMRLSLMQTIRNKPIPIFSIFYQMLWPYPKSHIFVPLFGYEYFILKIKLDNNSNMISLQ